MRGAFFALAEGATELGLWWCLPSKVTMLGLGAMAAEVGLNVRGGKDKASFAAVPCGDFRLSEGF